MPLVTQKQISEGVRSRNLPFRALPTQYVLFRFYSLTKSFWLIKASIIRYDIYYPNTVTIFKFLRLVAENVAVWSFTFKPGGYDATQAQCFTCYACLM